MNYIRSPAVSASLHTLMSVGSEYLTPEAIELCRRVQNRDSLSQDEVLLLAVAACQAALAKYVEPDNRSAEHALNTIFTILDQDEVLQVIADKIDEALAHSDPPAPPEKAGATSRP